MAREAVKKMSPVKRLAGFLLIGLFMIGGFAVGFWLTGSGKPSEAPEVSDRSLVIGHVVVMFLAGIFFLGAGVAGYAVVFATRCFTFDFSKPFWNSFKKKLYVANIVVVTLVGIGVACLVSMVVTPVLSVFGLSWIVSTMIPFVGVFALAQFVTIWVNIWQPLEKSPIRRRLPLCGVSEQDIERGMYMGISDPAKSSLKKMTMVEEDVGMLWLGNDKLVYMGDTDSFSIGRDQLIEVERAVDAGSMSAYCGNTHVIIRLQMNDGAQRRVRLHCEGCWTMTARARASDNLAENLVGWKQGQAQKLAP